MDKTTEEKKEKLVKMLMKDDMNRMNPVAVVRSGSNSSATPSSTFSTNQIVK